MKASKAREQQTRQESSPKPHSPARPKMGIASVLALLKNKAFCDEATDLLRKIATFVETAPPDEQREAFVSQQTSPFVEKWGVPPPHAPSLVDPDPARPFADAIMSGRWGIVAVFGWTTDLEIRAAIKRIRSVVRKRHQDAQIAPLAQQARWLEGCGYSRPEIASAVWGRRKGLRRRSKEQAMAGLPEGVEREWYK